MNANVEIIIRPEGVVKRSFREEPISITENITNALAAKVMRKMDKVAMVGGNYGHAGVALQQNGFSTWSIRVLTMPMHCAWTLNHDVLTPVFDANKDSLPVMSLKWAAPVDMRLYLVSQVKPVGAGQQSVDQSLVALDDSGRTYRLPTSNVYKTCRLCSGQKDHKSKVHFDALTVVKEVCAQFDGSKWNADLYDSTERSRTNRLFRFKPTDAGAEQLLTEGHWTEICEKVAVEALRETLTNP